MLESTRRNVAHVVPISCETIQQAIDLTRSVWRSKHGENVCLGPGADKPIVLVRPGTYEENIIIDYPLKVQSDESDCTLFDDSSPKESRMTSFHLVSHFTRVGFGSKTNFPHK